MFGVLVEELEWFDDDEAADLLNKEDKSGPQKSLDTALEGEVGGVGLTLGGVCNTELLEFSRTESKNLSADLDVSKNDNAAVKLSLELSLCTSISAPPLLQIIFELLGVGVLLLLTQLKFDVGLGFEGWI